MNVIRSWFSEFSKPFPSPNSLPYKIQCFVYDLTTLNLRSGKFALDPYGESSNDICKDVIPAATDDIGFHDASANPTNDGSTENDKL